MAEVQALLGDLPRRPDLLIECLHRIQDARGHLSARHLTALAAELRLAMAEVYEVATFYEHFDVVKEEDEAPPPLTVRVCDSISCALAGGEALRTQLAARLGPDVRVVPASCIGRCDHAPAVEVGHAPLHAATVERVETEVRAGRTTARPAAYPAYAEYRTAGGYELLRSCVAGERTPEEVAASVLASGLRGLGGAGFPAGRKWEFVRREPKPRMVVLNADEGEPGTFKDRFLLESDPHRVLEGLLLAAWVVEAEDVFVYVRDEYAGARKVLGECVASLEAAPPCSVPRIHVRRGAGAYICGEETALIESVEGKRGEPRLRPPFPAQVGVFGRPTLVHNVETVYWLREILERGAEAFAGAGVRGRKGKRLFSVSGRVARPGVYAAPAGVTARELIEEHAGGMAPGHRFYGYLPGGASGGILPAELGDLPLDFDVLAPYGCFIGSAAIVILSDHDRARDAALNLMRFFAHESCGKCTPCRVGTAKAVELLQAAEWDVPLLEELSRAMMDASICGLGQAAPNPVRSVVRYFPQELTT
ncbi:MAG TPA: NADH-ubiquinone oxidoreductase-F iron-sulfur binding region domain-containing protein [Longimicrobiales bacterium]|nr:NADH-ubiquinone oxidoreductase-F iron-sulfur binding region domain-containing protein [Longimicrobiales bacterium]